MNKTKRWHKLTALVLIAGLGACCLLTARQLSRWESPQVSAYNDGLAAFKAGKADEAMLAFDKSLDVYAAEKNHEALLYPSRSTEIAALAQSKKALVYLMKQKPELAIKAFKDSIILNPGIQDGKLLARLLPDEKLSAEDIARLSEQSAVVKHNLELLFKKNSSLADQEGKGKGKPSDKDGKPGNEPANGSKPGPGSGKGNPNAI